MIAMPKTGPFDAAVWPFERHLRFVICVAVPITSLLLAGCGGDEDFSKPPAQIQNQLAKAAQDPAARSVDGTEPATDDPGRSAATPAADAAATGAAATNGETSPVTATSAEPAVPVTPKSTDAASEDAAEVMTASGKSADAITAKKEANSSKSVIGNAGGLLGSLKSDAEKKADAAATAKPSTDSDAPQITARFGRLAVSRLQWLQLVSQLTRQFFIASTPDGNGLVCSTGERSLEALDTQLDVRCQILTAPASLVSQDAANPIQVPVTGLPGIINSVELTDDGQQVLVGTTDGRLLVRSAANTADWDLFARDLFLFQDEHRRTGLAICAREIWWCSA